MTKLKNNQKFDYTKKKKFYYRSPFTFSFFFDVVPSLIP